MTTGGRIILHVGAPKTGSTYLQKRLRANAAELRDRGVYLPVLPVVAAMAGNAKLLATVLNGAPTVSFRRAFPDLDVEALTPEQVLEELLRDWRREEEDIILSAEDFESVHAHSLRGLLPSRAEVVVILFARRQDLWVESYFRQLIKTQDIAYDLDTCVHMICGASVGRLYRPDWLEHYRGWRTHFEQTHLLCYDAVKDKLFDAFLAAAGLHRLAGLPDLGRIKVAMNSLQLAYLAALPADLPFSAFLEHRRACDEVSSRDGVTCQANLLSSSAFAEIKERYQASNTELLDLLDRSEFQSLLQPQTPPSSATPLADLMRTGAYGRFRDEVGAMLEAGRIGLADVAA